MITVGMYYDVVPGKESEFEAKFDRVLEAMQDQSGHVESLLFRQVRHEGRYAILSEWESHGAFQTFLGSDLFRRVTDWGRSGILAGRPRHSVYSRTADLS